MMCRLLTYYFDEKADKHVIESISEREYDAPFDLPIGVHGTSAFVDISCYDELAYILKNNIMSLYFNRHSHEIIGEYKGEMCSLNYIVLNFDTIRSIYDKR